VKNLSIPNSDLDIKLYLPLKAFHNVNNYSHLGFYLSKSGKKIFIDENHVKMNNKTILIKKLVTNYYETGKKM